jgi:hypothetical protein
LTNYGMVAITGEWMENPQLVAEITKHPLGPPVWTEVQAAHTLVEEHGQQRSTVEKIIARLTELSSTWDDTHDRKARALRALLLALVDATDDPERARVFLDLDALLFPHQLRIVHMSYLEEAGAARDVEKRVTPEILSVLESVRVDGQSLADVYRAWIEAGKQLGHHVQERARVEASLGQDGTATPRTSVRKVRAAWIRAVHLLLDVQVFLGMSAEAREMLMAPLQDGIEDALVRRRARSPGTPDEQDLPGPDDNDIDNDIDSDVGGDIDSDMGLGIHAHVDSDLDAPTLELDEGMIGDVIAGDAIL